MTGKNPGRSVLSSWPSFDERIGTSIPLPEKRIMFQGVEETKDEEGKASTVIRNRHDEDY
jgi:hypothetical protein